MMSVVIFPFLFALQTENVLQSQELSLTPCCSRCDVFRIAVKISECIRFGQNMQFKMAQFEVAIKSIPCWYGALFKIYINVFFLSCLYTVCYINIILNWYILRL